MLLRDLIKVYIFEYESVNNHGEKRKKWKYKGFAWLNFQQDINELDRKSTGEVDYSIVNARTDKIYDIQIGNGISLSSITDSEVFVPDYKVIDSPKIGDTILYKLEKLQK